MKGVGVFPFCSKAFAMTLLSPWHQTASTAFSVPAQRCSAHARNSPENDLQLQAAIFTRTILSCVGGFSAVGSVCRASEASRLELSRFPARDKKFPARAPKIPCFGTAGRRQNRGFPGLLARRGAREPQNSLLAGNLVAPLSGQRTSSVTR